MRKIFEYRIDYCGRGSLTISTHAIPEGATFLSMQPTDNMVVLWFSADADEPKECHMFHVVKAGEEVPQPAAQNILNYCGVAQFGAGRFIVHIFDEHPRVPLPASDYLDIPAFLRRGND